MLLLGDDDARSTGHGTSSVHGTDPAVPATEEFLLVDGSSCLGGGGGGIVDIMRGRLLLCFENNNDEGANKL